jgi:GT2 family glycosyltransferase
MASVASAPQTSDSLDLLDWVPRSARRILLIGGPQTLAEALHARAETQVWCVETEAAAASEARAPKDVHVVSCNLATVEAWSAPEALDCIIATTALLFFSDVRAWLRRARNWLRPEGCLLAVVPNIRHHAVVGGLLEGSWRPAQAPHDARTPVRFWTRRELEKLFYRSSWQLERLQSVPGSEYDQWQRRGRPHEVIVGPLQLSCLKAKEAEEFYVGHYRLDARPAAIPDWGRTSIVIVTHNQLVYTRLCVESIRHYTDEPYELIFVDNASTDGTPSYLAGIAGAKVIRNFDNRGFPAAVNQGLRAAGGRHVLLLNNDTVVTTGWLRRLLRALESDSHIGLAGPCSNCVSGEQQVEVSYDDLAQLDGFAWEWGKTQNRLWVETDRLVGFCFLIRHELLDRIGFLDERFGIGCFEDDDYCRRAIHAGFRTVMVRDAFVHHFGGRTFVASGVDFAEVMRTNQKRFHEKWHVTATSDVPSPQAETESTPPVRQTYRTRMSPSSGLLLGYGGVETSLCMIVRDNERTIGPCLESIRGAVEDVVVVDTGSKDDTPVIARKLGARVFHFPWCDSFAAARNESLRHARGEWIFWMDSDDTIDPENARKLHALVRQKADSRIMGYVVSVHCPAASGPEDCDVTVVQHVKLFRNFPQLRFDGRIHEQIIPSVRAVGGDIGWTDL